VFRIETVLENVKERLEDTEGGWNVGLPPFL
jgi:hypothetical protein